MCLGAHVYQIRRYTTYAALAIGATRSFLGLGIKLIKPVNGTLKDMTFDLQARSQNQWNILSLLQNSLTTLTIPSSSGGSLVWNLTEVPSL